MMNTEWIAVDWGTSNLRAWVFDQDGQTFQKLSSDQGMGTLATDEFEAVLLSLIDPFLSDTKTPVICCGMVGAKQGWSEAPYATVPCAPPTALTAVKVSAQDPRLDVRTLPGLQQPEPADVMRGEETQIAGYLALNPNFDGTLCLPGTHTKWVQISAGEVVSFRTFMTGELFALLSQHSVLRHSVGGSPDQEAFKSAVQDALARPQQLASRLFGIRANGLLHGTDQAASTGALSGQLIGAELAAAKPYWLGQAVTLIGDQSLCDLYAHGLNLMAVQPEVRVGDDLTLAGLMAAYRDLKGSVL